MAKRAELQSPWRVTITNINLGKAREEKRKTTTSHLWVWYGSHRKKNAKTTTTEGHSERVSSYR